MSGILLVAAIVGIFILFVKLRDQDRQLLHGQRMLKDLAGQVAEIRAALQRLREKTEPVEPASSAQTETISAPVHATEKPEAAPPPIQAAPQPQFSPMPKRAPAETTDWEEALTSRWMVWVGAIAIALGGTFLVKYTIDQGLLGPTARVTLGFLLGVALTVTGEWLRQRPLQRAISAIQPNYVPPALTASGLFIVFASIYTAYAVYGLLPPLVAFVALASVALLAVGLSLLQGMLVALLGLLGGFVTPALISTPNPSVWGLFCYLFVVESACLAVARYRDSSWFALATLAGAAFWPIAWIALDYWRLGDELTLGLYLLSTILVFFFLPSRAITASGSDKAAPKFATLSQVALAAQCALVAVMFLVIVAADYSATSLILFGLVAACCLVIARREDVFEGAVIASALATIAIAATMSLPRSVVLPVRLPGSPLIPPELLQYASANASLGAFFALAGFVALWGAKRPAIWAGVSAGVPLFLLAIAYWRIVDFGVDLAWAGIALALAAASLFATERVERYRTAGELEISLGIYAAATVAFISLAAAMSLREAWLTVALSLQLPALGWISRRVYARAIPVIATIVAAIVIVRLALNYNIFAYPIAHAPATNWVLYGYGIPALAFFWASRLFRKQGENQLGAMLEAGALGFFVLLVSLQIRLFVAGELNAWRYSLLEQGLQSIAWLSIGTILVSRRVKTQNVLLHYGALMLMGLGAAQVLLIQLIASNPIFTRELVGDYPVVNVLFLSYAVPAAFAFWFAAACRDEGWRTQFAGSSDIGRQLGNFSGIAGFVLLFAYLSLEVRRAFHGPILVSNFQGDAESYTYSAVWLLYAVALLGLGIYFRQSALRYASLAVLVVTASKVFLLDMSDLMGLYRVASFLGLGLSFVGIGYLYQRFVFRRAVLAD